jgi:putative oxygen-independent coproporphyrinogen III oxidase
MHLYLHIPFCARRCSYCDFAIAVRRETPSEEYVDRVLAEWARCREDPRWAGFATLNTLYLGGGTPSRLAPDALNRLLDQLLDDRPLAPGAEVTLEANPEDVTLATARAWSAAGVNRISLGVQSFEPAVLTWMHRTHDAAQVPRAVMALREAGFDNLSLDLIYSLPAELPRDWSRDLDLAMALAPEHLSLYGLTVEEHTPLGHWVARGETRPSPDERYADEFLIAHRTLTGAGYRHYEVSNYGRPGREAVHNGAYWRRASFLGLGPSAHSGIGASRWWNIRDWTEWSRAITAGDSTVAASEELSPEAVAIEDLYLGLRTDSGVPVSVVSAPDLAAWKAEGWAEEAEGRVRLSAEGWLRLDALVGASGVG